MSLLGPSKSRGPNYQKERGERQIKRICEFLERGPANKITIAESCFMAGSTAMGYIKRLRAENRVFICGHTANGSGRPAPIYQLGEGVDKVFCRVKRKHQGKGTRPSMDERSKEALKILRSAKTSAELGILMKIAQSRANRYIRDLRAQGKVFIMGYRQPPNGGDQSPVYMAGKQPDAVKRRITRAERYAATMANPVKAERELMKRKTRLVVEKAKRKPQSIFSALGL